ncbi:MAG: dephospho-CoA kinase [Waddliaceae bacterium]|nr:dephospho-CoA kinase [Waddliaceae bacterium]
MLILKKLAITGTISSGKSSVTSIFKDLGAYIVSADEIVHRLMSLETQVGQKIVELIGPDILTNNSIDRRKVAAKVFQDPHLLDSLEKLLHPEVLKIVRQEYELACSEEKYTLFVAEVPLLFESEESFGFQNYFDLTLTVDADPSLRLQRFIESTGYDEKEFERRSARQFTAEYKCQKADIVLINNAGEKELRESVSVLFDQICK